MEIYLFSLCFLFWYSPLKVVFCFFLSTCISWKKFSLFNLVWYNNCHCNAGFESASNCNSSNYWYSSEDEYIWCWEQGYPYTQSHWGITSFVHLLILLTAFGVLYYFESHFVLYFQYSAKLLKKPDQCRAVYACSHLFWVDDQDGIKDGERCRSVFPVLYDQNKYVKGFPFDNCSKDIIIFKLNFSCFPRDAWLELQTEISLLIVIVPSLLIKILEKLYREVGISAFCILIVFSVLPFAGFFFVWSVPWGLRMLLSKWLVLQEAAAGQLHYLWKYWTSVCSIDQ